MRTLTWNCRGYCNTNTIRHLKDLIATNNPDIIFFSKTKSSDPQLNTSLLRLNYPNHLVIPANNKAGGLCLLWKGGISITTISTTYNSITAHINLHTNHHWIACFFYGSPYKPCKDKSWEPIRALSSFNSPILIIGDLNVILDPEESSTETKPSRDEQERVLRPLIDRVVQHYEDYYRTKTISGKQDVLSVLSPSWTSTLEDAFLWIGGWRPSMAFHLLYSKSGLQMESKLAEIIRGLGTGDLGDLSPSQLVSVDELQRKTIKEERNITEKMAKHQETVADTSMVELSHIMTEFQNREIDDERVNSTLGPKKEGLQKILEGADDLRLRTLNGVISILTPIQAVHFLIAAAELHLRIHDWGKKKDAAQNHANSTGAGAGAGHTKGGIQHRAPGQLPQ
ncbi:hypothetical protein IFM89_028316 [Coptis chinensis]|uniref:DOG1 domain-containing protein n=1 Tax=Coptis chinensis TaxID=261450 RepID=A0A835M5A2_9MAGN|nr:hypothetical protein IFM89_028316 [Coptis chinensis]